MIMDCPLWMLWSMEFNIYGVNIKSDGPADMGDGGVACIPLQQQQHVIERLPNAAAEKALSGNGFGSGLLKAAGKRKKKKVKVKKKVAPAAKKVVNSELAVEGVGSRGGNDVESGGVCGEKYCLERR